MDSQNKILLIEEAKAQSKRWAHGYEKIYFYEGSSIIGERLKDDFSVDQVDYHGAYYKAGQAIDWVMSQYIKSAEIQIFNELFKNEHAYFILKKEVTLALARLFFSFSLAEKFIQEFAIKGGIDFVPEEFSLSLYQVLCQRKGLLPDFIRIPERFIQQMKRKEILSNIFLRLAFIFYPLMICFKMPWRKAKNGKKTYRFGVHVWNTWFGLSSEPYRMECLEDPHGGVQPHNTLYVAEGELSLVNIQKLRSNGYDFCYFKELFSKMNIFEYLREIYPSVRFVSGQMLGVSSRKLLLTSALVKSMRSFLLWQIFFKLYDVEYFITVQEPGNVRRVFCQKNHGVKEHIFIFLSSSYNPFYRENMHTHDDSNYGFLVYDKIFTNRMSIEYLRNNNNLAEYIDGGLVRSDVIWQTKRDPQRQIQLKRELGVPEDKIVLGFFDTKIGRMGMLTDEEGFKIMEDMYRLLESDQKYVLLLRSRGINSLAENSNVQKSFQKLLAHPRVIYTNKIAPRYYAFDVMGICDLCIGIFTSSAPLESLVGGVKAICYVPSARFDKDVFVMNSFPQFCVKNFDELKSCVHYWLHEANDADFQCLQDFYVKKYVDSYCDGRATERLKQALRELGGEKPEVNVDVKILEEIQL